MGKTDWPTRPDPNFLLCHLPKTRLADLEGSLRVFHPSSLGTQWGCSAVSAPVADPRAQLGCIAISVEVCETTDAASGWIWAEQCCLPQAGSAVGTKAAGRLGGARVPAHRLRALLGLKVGHSRTPAVIPDWR